MCELQDRVALVTGGSSGIGRATALCLAEAGAQVAILGRDRQEVEQVAREITHRGGSCLALTADVSSADEMSRQMQVLLDTWDRLDIVVANAGINGVWAPIDELSPEDWRQTIDINLTGTFLTIKFAAPALRKRGGSIVVMSSINGTRVFSNGGASAYASSKAAQVALAKMLALELADDRIRVNAICPGTIATPIHQKTERHNVARATERVEFPDGTIPLTDGRPGEPEQVAALVRFLVSDQAMHITGSTVFVDGGQSLLQG